MRKFRVIFSVAAMLVFSVLPRSGVALELGLTPSNVFALWININKAMVVYAEAISDDGDWLKTVRAMTPRAFQGKTPKDVLAKAMQFDSGLRELRTTTPGHTDVSLFETQILLHIGEKDSHANPSLVFLRSGHLLIEVLENLLKISQAKVRVGMFFGEAEYHDKTPSDVFAQIDMAFRRLEAILKRQTAAAPARGKAAP